MTKAKPLKFRSLALPPTLGLPTSPPTLFSPQDYAEIEVVFDESGEIERLDGTTCGQTYQPPRVGELKVNKVTG